MRHTELHPQSPKPASPAPPPSNPDVIVEDCELESCFSEHSLAPSERDKKDKKAGGGGTSHLSPSLPAKKNKDIDTVGGGGGVEVKTRTFIPFMNRSKSSAVPARGGLMVRINNFIATQSIECISS